MDTNIQKYAAFVKVVDCGSFTKAAESLSYTQSGISRMIGDLEREWKVILLERDRNGVRLTPDGERLLPYARKVCEEYRNLQFQVDELNGLESGMIRIGTFSSVATHWLPKMIKEFQKDYPHCPPIHVNPHLFLVDQIPLVLLRFLSILFHSHQKPKIKHSLMA